MSDRPNVLVLVLDSVRYDRTTVGGHDRDTTPNLARIAAEPDGGSFDHAVAHARYTLPSSASILTGSYPGDHGVGMGVRSLPDDVRTVAEAFRAAGYRTALVSSNHFVSAETGLDRGFDTAVRLPETPLDLVRTVGVPTLLRWVANIRSHSAGFEPDKYRHSTGFLTASLARRRLEALTDAEPYFCYVHLNQPHRPYYPPLAWFDRYGDAYEMSRDAAAEFSMTVHENLVETVARGCQLTDDEWTTLLALYDAGVEYTDTFVGELYDLARDGGSRDTVVAVTADHGEHFGERGALGHKYVLDDALLRVPLVTAGLDVDVDGSPVQHTDLMRTLLSVAGAETGVVDGVDLRRERRTVAVSQDTERSLERLREVDPDFDADRFYLGA
jgi:uncharacterized sulfatase